MRSALEPLVAEPDQIPKEFDDAVRDEDGQADSQQQTEDLRHSGPTIGSVP